MVTILILGSKGYIGSHLCDHFLHKNYKVVGCDLTNVGDASYPYYQLSILSGDLESIFIDHQYNYCINASGAANVYDSVLHPVSDFEGNSLAVARVLDMIRKHQPACKYLHISSAAVYGNPSRLPVKESDPLNPISPYGYHKLISEVLCKEYFHLYGLPVAIIRPFSIFGNGLKKQLLWDTCFKLRQNDTVTLFGTGNETRDFIHISDFVRLVETVISKSVFKVEIFNAASGKEITIRQIADMFENYYDGSKKIVFNGETKTGDPLHWKADIAAVKNLGFSVRADFENSVIDYINWFNKVYES